MRYIAILVFLVLSLSTGCKNINKISEPSVLYKSITLSPQTYIYDQPVSRSQRVETLKEGESIEILQDPKNRWLKVRISSGKTGWVESRDVLRREYIEEWEQLKTRIGKREPQIKGDTLDDAYLRLRPGRDTVKVYKMFGTKTLEIFDVVHTERPGKKLAEQANPANTKATPPVQPIETKGKKGKKGKDPGSERKFDTWFLARTPEGTVGWIYSGLVDIHIPEELAMLAENKNIVSWKILAHTEAQEGKEHPLYLSIEREPNSNKDFDRVRVLIWNIKRSRYDALIRISDLNGIFPVESTPAANSKSYPSFKIRYLSKDNPNTIIVDDYEVIGQQVKKVNSATENLQIINDEPMDNS